MPIKELEERSADDFLVVTVSNPKANKVRTRRNCGKVEYVR